jgi:hypothetical protein
MRLLSPNESLYVVQGRSSRANSPLHTCGSISQRWGRGELLYSGGGTVGWKPFRVHLVGGTRN